MGAFGSDDSFLPLPALPPDELLVERFLLRVADFSLVPLFDTLAFFCARVFLGLVTVLTAANSEAGALLIFGLLMGLLPCLRLLERLVSEAGDACEP